MSALLLARIQFAVTVMFHYIFPQLTIGLSAILVIMATLRLKRSDPVYDRMLKFWVHLFAINFAVGVATGIVMEFEFGTNWAPYSKFVGDIFGAPLAAEGIFAFFLESAFLGLLLFGWNRVSKRTHWFATLMVAFGSMLSAFWIIVANSWQQTPAGYEMVNGRPHLASFWGAVFNPSTLPRFFHVLMGAWITGAFVVTGISAYYLLKKRHLEFAKKSMAIGIIFALIAIMGSIFFGDMQARQVAHHQPEKFAAMEALFRTQAGAPLLVLGYPLPNLGINKLLSFMVYFNFNAKVTGLDAFPPKDLPPVAATAMSFHAMVWLGMLLFLASLFGVYLLWRRKLFEKRWFLRSLLFLIPLPFIINEVGWVTAEVGRQPWIVYHLLRTRDAVSITVPAGQILASLIMFLLVYSLLFGVALYLVRKMIQKGPVAHEEEVSR
jgi:cytochrome bd ubiquinol oxidase subunit I